MTSNDPASRALTAATAQDGTVASLPAPLAEQASWARVVRHARCADSALDPDQWFPVSIDGYKARREAAAAIAVCMACPVRVHCLALSLRHWDIGQYGIWGGLVPAERVQLARQMRVDHTGGGKIAWPASFGC